MNDAEFSQALYNLQRAGIKYIIDFTTSIIPYTDLPRTIAGELKNRLTNKNPGRFHGYQRTTGDLMRIYRKAGWKIINTEMVGTYYCIVADNNMLWQT